MALVESSSGIRGLYGKELTKQIAGKYAQAFSEFLNKKYKSPKIVIGRDTRASGKELFNEIVKTLNCEIINMGILPTPIIENAVRAFKADAGIIITASHNEPEYNGFKFLDKTGAQLSKKDSEILIKKANETKKEYLKINNNPKIENLEKEAIEHYKKFIKNILKQDKLEKIKIIVDPNGGTGIISKEIFSEFNINAQYINMNKGEFKRTVEPNKESLIYLKGKIKENNADFAIGFDCDADRVEILLKNGELLSGNHLIALITDYILSNNPSNQTVVVNEVTSYSVKEIAEKHNSRFEEAEVGETNIINKIDELNSIIGGEGSSGGVIMPPSRCRDGILTTLYLLKIMQEKEKSLEQLVEQLPKYFYLKEKIKLKKDFAELKEKVIQYYNEKGYELKQLGGLKFIKNNSWISIRQSNTEDKTLRFIADSKDMDTTKNLLKQARELIDKLSSN